VSVQGFRGSRVQEFKGSEVQKVQRFKRFKRFRGSRFRGSGSEVLVQKFGFTRSRGSTSRVQQR
jgi:hypothetical protein